MPLTSCAMRRVLSQGGVPAPMGGASKRIPDFMEESSGNQESVIVLCA